MNTFRVMLSIVILFTACSKTTPVNEPSAEPPLSQRNCGAMEALQQQLSQDPQLGARMQAIETHTQQLLRERSLSRQLAGAQIEIPVVVNILYRTAAENISVAQVQSQIDILERDFNGANTDFSKVPALFSGVKASVGVHFRLQNIVRKATGKKSWGTNDAMKKSDKGGIDPTTPGSVLNIWVVNALKSGYLGYAQFPGGDPATDGVVIAHQYFGNTGTATVPFNLGRTATHEVGHYLNLRHIWGDTNCGTDYVGDTPPHNTANYECPGYPHYSTCSGSPVEMTMNYMDYTDDGCMYMFTAGQRDRMLATFTSGGGRSGFARR
jgi:hypothetical protein